jgi:hypothetical protein
MIFFIALALPSLKDRVEIWWPNEPRVKNCKNMRDYLAGAAAEIGLLG